MKEHTWAARSARHRVVCCVAGTWHSAVFFLLLSSAPAGAIDIPVEARVRNIGGYCTWASLDTLARANGIEQLQGVMEARRASKRTAADPGYDSVIEAELRARGVRYLLRRQFSFERDLLDQYANSHGVAVSLKAGNPWSIGCHTIVVTRYDETTVEFYDSSKPVDASQQPKVWSCGRGWFDAWWLGSSVVILPNEAADEQLAGAG